MSLDAKPANHAGNRPKANGPIADSSNAANANEVDGSNANGSIDSDRSSVIRELAKKLRQVEVDRGHDTKTNFADVERFDQQRRESCVSTGINVLDELLPDDGFRKGTIVEWISDDTGSGAMTLALLSASKILRHGVSVSIADRFRQKLLVIDSKHEFYPMAAASLGIDLSRTIVVRPDASSAHRTGTRANKNDELWALEQSLRSKAIGLTLASVDHLNGHTFRRLQLAAETGGGLCFLRRPMQAARQPTWADVRLQVTANGLPANESLHRSAIRRLTIKLLKCRAGLSGDNVVVDYHDETHDVRLAAELARPAAADRSA